MNKDELIQLLSFAIDFFNPLNEEIIQDFLISQCRIGFEGRFDWEDVFRTFERRLNR